MVRLFVQVSSFGALFEDPLCNWKAVVVHRWSVQELWEFGCKTCFIGGCLIDSKRRIYIFLHLFSAVSRSVTSWLGNWGYYLCNCSAHWICNIVKVDPLVLFPWRTLGLDRTPLRQLLKLGPGVCFFVMYISWSGKGQAVFTWHFAQFMDIKKAQTHFMCIVWCMDLISHWFFTVQILSALTRYSSCIRHGGIQVVL